MAERAIRLVASWGGGLLSAISGGALPTSSASSSVNLANSEGGIRSSVVQDVRVLRGTTRRAMRRQVALNVKEYARTCGVDLEQMAEQMRDVQTQIAAARGDN